MNHRAISRRTALRGLLAGGVAVSVPLPRLAGMLNGNGTAYAQDGAALPRRFGTWFFGNGIIPDRWVPSTTGQGAAWQLSEQLAPLAEVKPWLSVLTGLSIKVPNNSPHASHPCAAMTGANTGPGQVRLPSIDQLIAPAISGGAAYPTGIHAALSGQTGATALGLAVSYRGPNAANPPTYSPTTLYQELLGFTSNGTPAAVDPELLYRQSVLDAVAQDATALKGRLGAEDQIRLDHHLDGLNELQGRITRLATPITTGPVPNPDELYPARGEDGSISRERNQAFSDLLVFALATDLTRVFTYMFTTSASHGNYADCGLANSSFHEDYGHRLSRTGLSAATRGFNTGVKYAMSNLADLLTKMKDVPEGGGNLLDNSTIYVTSCVSESQTHSGNDYPLLVAGKAGGAIRSDQHVRLLDENVSKVPFTLLNALGGTAEGFGEAEGRVTSGISELLA